MGESNPQRYLRTTSFERPSQNIVKYLLEGTTHLLKNISSTAACQTAHPFRRGRASTTGIQDLDVEKRVLSGNELQENGILSPFRRRLSISTTSSSRTGSTFFPDVKVKSIYLHDTRRELPDKIMEGDSGWVSQGVLSRASFRRQPLSDQKTLTDLSLHINNVYAKKRDIGKKLILTIRAVTLEENVDLDAGDFNGAAWRRDNSNNISIIEEVFADCALPMPPGPTPLWVPESIPGNLG